MVNVIFDDIDIASEILVESFESASDALEIVGSKIVPEALAANFASKGTRGQMPEWLNVSANSIEPVREVNPSYRTNPNLNQPLIDTGSLMNSATTTRQEFVIETTLDPYGFPHDNGTALRPDGVEVPQREHMYIVEGEDTGKIDKVFEEEFQK